jgi:hypothetical protein
MVRPHASSSYSLQYCLNSMTTRFWYFFYALESYVVGFQWDQKYSDSDCDWHGEPLPPSWFLLRKTDLQITQLFSCYGTAQIDDEREGKSIDRDLLNNVLDIFVQTGDGNLDIYRDDFETDIFQRYYKLLF